MGTGHTSEARVEGARREIGQCFFYNPPRGFVVGGVASRDFRSQQSSSGQGRMDRSVGARLSVIAVEILV